MHATFARISAAALIGLTVAAAGLTPASATETQTRKQQPPLDTTVTGSVPSRDVKFCDPNDPKADIVCKVTRGRADARFPSAPSNPAFGF